MRFGIFVMVFADVLAGIVAAWLLSRVKTPWRSILALGLLFFVIFDFFPTPMKEYSLIQSRPIDSWLSKQPGDGAVVQFPFQLVEDQDQVYYTLSYNKPFRRFLMRFPRAVPKHTADFNEFSQPGVSRFTQGPWCSVCSGRFVLLSGFRPDASRY
jgi:hypothetical protein